MGKCGDDYHGEMALLTTDGDIYVTNLCDYSGEYSAQFDSKAFDSLSKIESNNKYVDVGEILQNYKYYEEEYEGDTFPYKFVGITSDGKKDLIGEFINGEYEE